MQIEIVREIQGAFELQVAWENLSKDLGDEVSAFGSYAWYETWWRHYSAGASLYLLTLRESDKLVGIAPLMRRQATLHGLPISVIGFIENANSLHNDFIVMPAARELFLREVLRVLVKEATQWDVIILNNLPVPSANRGALVKILDEAGMKWHQEQTFISPYMMLSGEWTNYLASRTSRTRKTLRNIQNSIAKAGEVSVRNIRTWDEYREIKKDIYFVAKQSWTEEIGDSLATSVNEAFFDDLAHSAATKVWLSVWTLHLNGKVIAFEFHLKACGKDHAMRGSYLPEFAHLSPGTYLEMQILKSAFEDTEKVNKYDFGGSFDSYKRKWTDDAVPHCAISVFNDRMYSRFVSFHETKTVPLVKRVRDTIKRVRPSIPVL
jgi:CelD/BcsL family acetyltransferase involved in cellulose biosynthesis